MSFPVVESTATSVTSSSITTHTITTPSGVVSGDLLIAFIGIEDLTTPGGGQFSGVSDGFTEIKDACQGGPNACAGVFFKVSDGTEGANITVTSVDAERAAHCMYRISGFDSAIDPEISAGATATSAAPNPDSLTPAGGAKDFLWMVFTAFERDDETITGFPTNYGSNQINNAQASGATIGVATRNLNAASEDPGAFTLSGSEPWQAFTLAVHPLVPTAAVTGTAEPTSTETQITAGGRTIIIDLTDDTWVASGATFNAIRQDIIDGLDSAQSEALGWNAEVRDKEVVTAVVRNNDTTVTITLTAQPGYDITATETITVTVPASAVTSGEAIVATPTFTVTSVAATAVISGTATATIDEADVVTGGKTIIITLANGSWVAAGATFNAERQAIIDGLDSAQVEATGWNAEVRDNEVVGAVVRTSQRVVTITLTAQAAYNISAQETITVTVPASAINEVGAIVGTPTFTVDIVAITAAITGTIAPSSTEAQIISGGRTIIITLTADTWVASGGTFDAIRQDIIDGLDSAQSELTGWNAEVRDKQLVAGVVRTSPTVVTITLDAQAAYNITAFETITVTVPASALVASGSPVVATPIFLITQIPVAIVTGTVAPTVNESLIVAGGRTIIITLADDIWVASGATFDAVRQDIIDGLDSAQSELTGWNAEVRDKEVVTAVVRTSDTVVTITLTAQAAYDITANELIIVTVPASALDATALPITGIPPFAVTFTVPIPGPGDPDPFASIAGNGLGGISRNHTPPGVIVNR